MIKYCFITIFFLRLNLIFSQVNQEWIDRYDGISGNIMTGVSLTTDGNNLYVACAQDIQGSETGVDICLIKYTKNGIKQWISLYNGPGNDNDEPKKVITDNLGNIYLVGRSSNNQTGIDFVTIKYNMSGAQEWVRRYSSVGDHNDAPYGIFIDKSNNVYVTGQSYDDSTFTVNCVTIKYNYLGEQIWLLKHSSGITQIGVKVAVDNFGNVFVTGRGNGDFLTIKYNMFGVKEWVRYYDGDINGNDGATQLGIDSAGNIYVSGTSEGNLHYSDFAAVKYDTDGNELWVRRYDGTANYEDQVWGMVVDRAGNVYLTGNGTQVGHGYDFTTIKYNTNGSELWIAKYHKGLNDIPLAITLDSSDGIYVTGESDGNGTQFDYATVKYDTAGNQKWVKRYDFSGQYEDMAKAITVDGNKNVYVTGSSNRHCLTIKYSQILTAIYQSNSNLLSGFPINQNYPNPFNPTTSISYQLSKSSNVLLVIYDAQGKKVSTLINENEPAGIHNVVFDGTNFPSGIYFYQLQVDGKIIDTKRMILLK